MLYFHNVFVIRVHLGIPSLPACNRHQVSLHHNIIYQNKVVRQDFSRQTKKKAKKKKKPSVLSRNDIQMSEL